MAKILVTGGNGFVAAHVLIATLNKGYEVVATIRNQDKAEQTRTALSSRVGDKISKLSFHIVPTIEADGAFDNVIQAHQFVAVLHTATPFHLKAKDPKEITGPAVGSTKSILKSIQTYGSTVKRVVITSSFAAIEDPSKGFRPGYVYTEADWNPITWEETHDGDPAHAYYGAKTWAERAAWDFMEEEKPGFELITLCPPMVYGEVAQYLPSTEALNTSSSRLYEILAGKVKEVPESNVVLFVNVQDLGNAHALAISAPNAGNKRFFITADAPFTNKSVSDIFIKHYPESASVVPTTLPAGVDQEGFPIGGYYTSDNSLSKRLLGLTYQNFDDTVAQFAESIKNLPEAS